MTDPTTPANPPAGWYPAPHANGENRYWDGAQWADAAPGAATTTTTPEQPKKKRLRWWMWVLIALGAIIVISAIGGAIGGGGKAAPVESKPAAEESSATPTAETVSVPDVVGMSTADATAKLEAAGLVATATGDTAGAVITTQTPAADAKVEKGSTVTLVAAVPEPEMTASQKNAVRKATDYLSLTAFSRQGLIDQLVYEQFSTEDATFAVDHLQADWNEQAAKKAQQYLDLTAFSRQGLIDQLVYEGFTPEQAEFGVTAVGL